MKKQSDDFSNPPKVKPPSICDGCGDLVHDSEVVKEVYFSGEFKHIKHFCSDECKCAWYIKHLREGL